MFISRLVDRILGAFGVMTNSAVLERRNEKFRLALLQANFEIRELKRENARVEDDAKSAWEMLEEIKTAENFLAANPKAIQDTLENIEDQLLIEMLQKTKTPYGEA